MSVNYRLIKCSPDEVFRVLADGWLYPSWVVGASRIRDVDEHWPAVGAKLHHSFGIWPAVIDDSSEVVAWDSPHHAELRARGWPTGEARVVLDVKPRRGPDGERWSVVRIVEHAVRGPATLIPTPLLDVPLYIRNIETLRRLAYLAEGGAAD